MEMKRRAFLTGLGVSAAAIAWGLPWVSWGKSAPSDTLNIGIIGTGDRGTGLANYIREIPNLRVTACCDVIPFRLESAMKLAAPGAKAYSDYQKLLADKDLDAVIISTPFSMHIPMAMDALDAGLHVYCEKTLGKGIEGIKKLIKKVRGSSQTFQTGHQYHSSRLYHKAVEIIQSGYIGKITAFECQWNRNGNWRRPVPDPQWERMINWRMYREYSGGLTAELCSHQIDFINWVLDAHPLTVMGIGGIDYWKDGRETYDNIHLLMLYPEGIKAKFTCLTSNALDDYKIKVFGDKGTIVLDYTKAWVYAENSIQKEIGVVDGVSGATVNAWKKGEAAPIDVEHLDPSKQALIDFYDNITSKKKPDSTVESGAKVAFTVQMALDAMDNQRIENWKPEYNV
ncbi:MAG: Gfo/Idh/MocA family oxidoreductase [Microscillaceae bacterium]|nr:Gfo/Idh/MocA family oxidoreductase [Microscillaceae bacterium]